VVGVLVVPFDGPQVDARAIGPNPNAVPVDEQPAVGILRHSATAAVCAVLRLATAAELEHDKHMVADADARIPFG
jgi:hypothetical protein